MGKSRLLDCTLICIANWTVVSDSLQEVLHIKPELFVLPSGYKVGVKHNWIAWVALALVDMTKVQNPLIT
jgi:hypothetical protein